MAKSFFHLNHSGANKIKTVNGVAFADLPQLVRVELDDTACISKSFEIERGSKKFRRKINRSCASADYVKRPLTCIASTNCDEFENSSRCCELDLDTRIDAPDYKFANDVKYKIFEFLIISHQPDVEFLPVSVHESFPNLTAYLIRKTPVRKISKKNFEKMYKLKVLALDQNEIEVIKSDTFEDLINVDRISICEY